jgi:hypothetical protein
MWAAFMTLNVQAVMRQDFLAFGCLATLLACQMRKDGML